MVSEMGTTLPASYSGLAEYFEIFRALIKAPMICWSISAFRFATPGGTKIVLAGRSSPPNSGGSRDNFSNTPARCSASAFSRLLIVAKSIGCGSDFPGLKNPNIFHLLQGNQAVCGFAMLATAGIQTPASRTSHHSPPVDSLPRWLILRPIWPRFDLSQRYDTPGNRGRNSRP